MEIGMRGLLRGVIGAALVVVMARAPANGQLPDARSALAQDAAAADVVEMIQDPWAGSVGNHRHSATAAGIASPLFGLIVHGNREPPHLSAEHTIAYTTLW